MTPLYWFLFLSLEFQPWGNQEHDIAVAKLAGKPLKFTDYVKPVCLPTFVPPVGDKLMITGWGSTQDVGPAKEKLKEIPLPLTSQKICAEQWGSKYKQFQSQTETGPKQTKNRPETNPKPTRNWPKINILLEYFNDGWMCTDPGYLEDACKGDSGGPAVHYDSFRTEFKNILQSVPNQPGKRTSARVNFGTNYLRHKWLTSAYAIL